MMKIKFLILGLALSGILLGGCNDELNQVGPSIQPSQDKITVFTDTFHLESSTVLMNAVYAKTDTSLLGEFFDPLYGTLKSDYICQFYCPDDFTFKHTPIDGKIDSIDYQIYYNSWIGDSLTPMRAQVFLVNEPLNKYYYTDMNPADYCNMQTVMGSQTYSAHDMSISDSIRTSGSYYPTVKIRMSKDFGQKFYDETINNPASFASQDAFNSFFPGIYVTNTFGTGNVLNVVKSQMTIYYKYITEGSEGQDSTAYSYEAFTATKEVIQLNRFLNTDLDQLTLPNEEYSYIKSPAGVCTRIVLPIKEIGSVVTDRILNNLAVNFQAMPQEPWQFALKQPQYLMLIPEDSVQTFFEQGQLPDNISTYVSGTFSSVVSLAYTFGNISNLLKHQLENDPEHDLALLVIPVNYQTSTNYYGTYPISTSNFLSPAGVKLRKDEEYRRLVVTSCRYN